MTKVPGQDSVLQWLIDGDAGVRWQVMRDLQKVPAAKWRRERAKMPDEGWGRRLLELRDADGTWGGGIYSPKWISTNYTLLTLRELGLPQNHPAARASARVVLDQDLGPIGAKDFGLRLIDKDLCITGMYLALACYFRLKDQRIEPMVEQLLAEQMADGGWNCKRRRCGAHHSSFHTTINVLDGLADYAEYCPGPAAEEVRAAIERAHQLLLEHRLFKSDKTGCVIHPNFVKLSFPSRWHYQAFRVLDHLRRMNVRRDPRLQDAIDLLCQKRLADGRWKLDLNHRGREFFILERQGRPSRFATLQALRILNWWHR